MPDSDQWPMYWVLLEIPADNPKPIKLLLKHKRCPTWGPVEEIHDEYFFEEHTCPTNYIGDVEVIAEGDDCDPHGMWKLKKTWPVLPDDDAEEVMRKIVEEEKASPPESLIDKEAQQIIDGLRYRGEPVKDLTREQLLVAMAAMHAQHDRMMRIGQMDPFTGRGVNPRS